MLKFSTAAKFSVILSLVLVFGAGQEFAYGLIPGLKNAVQSGKSDPADILVRNWGLDNSEQDSHINARKAWKITRGSKKVVVAVIDTGVDANHPDLKDNICRRNGSDEYGYDFVLNRKNPKDGHGHGSHVAGIIGATAKAGAGAAGVAPNVCIMAVRYYSEANTGAQNLSNTIKAINYAVDHGANIINYSGGGAEFSAAEMKALQRAEAKGVLIVAAAGNEYQNTDESGNAYYPAAYGLSNIIAVAATNIHNQILPSSNWGLKHVHVAAPGENIYSTLPNGRYGYLTGTSQATAFVSGLAALILSENPSLKPHEVREIIMKSANRFDSLRDKVASGGRIDAYAALQLTLARRDGGNMLAELKRQQQEENVVDTGLRKRTGQLNRDVAFH
jgi:subtilisin family serine protease